jgi:4'-phosphopantetheinyl transferase
MKLDGMMDYRIDERRIVTVMSADFHERSDNDISLLSSLERLRVGRILNDAGRSRFISSRAFLRRAVGQMLGAGPYRQEFVVGRFGKPFLPAPYSSLFFNLSHTKRVIVAAFVEGEALGVDIEGSEREISPPLQNYVFRPEELGSIFSAQDVRSAFLFGWVCKEAVLKCMGCGFARDAKNISVDLSRSQQPSFKAYDYSKTGRPGRAFRLVCLTHLQDTMGAIAIRDQRRCGDGARGIM